MGLSAMLYRKHKDIDTPHFGYASLYWLRHELSLHVGFRYTQDLKEPSEDDFYYQRYLSRLSDKDIDETKEGKKIVTNYHKFLFAKDETLRWTDETYDKYLWEFFMAPDSEGVIDLDHCKYYYDKFKNISLKDNQQRLDILLKVLKAGIDNNSSVVYL